MAASSRGGKFFVRLYSDQNYIDSFGTGGPTWFFPTDKHQAYRFSKKAWSTQAHRVVLRIGSSQPAADIHITISVRRKVGGTSPAGPSPAHSPPLDCYGGTKTEPMRLWDSVEAATVWALMGVGLLALLIVNILTVEGERATLAQGGPALVSLFQADAEWGVFLVALYVAAKTLPEWLAKRGGR